MNSICLIDLPKEVLCCIFYQLSGKTCYVSEYCAFLSCKTMMNAMIYYYKYCTINASQVEYHKGYWANRHDRYLLKELELKN